MRLYLLPQGRLFLLAVFITIIQANSAVATTLFSRPIAPTSPGEFADRLHIADNFSIFQNVTIDSVSWYGRYEGSVAITNPVSFSIRFFADAGGVPAINSLLQFSTSSTAVPTGTFYDDTPWLAYSSSTPVLNLTPGTYWVMIQETDSRSPDFHPFQWLWADTTALTGDTTTAYRTGDGETWTRNGPPGQNSDHAFTITGTVSSTSSVPDRGTTAGLSIISIGALWVVGLRARRTV